MTFRSIQEAAAHSHALSRQPNVLGHMREDPERAERWNPLLAQFKFKSDAARRRAEMMLDNAQAEIYKDAVKTPLVGQAVLSAINETLDAAGSLDEAASLSTTNANLPAQILALVASVQRGVIYDEIFGVQPLDRSSGDIWFLREMAGNTTGYYSDGDYLDIRSGNFDPTRYTTTEGADITELSANLSRTLVEAISYKLRANEPIERVQDAAAYFPGLDMMQFIGSRAFQQLGWMKQYAWLNTTLAAAVSEANNVAWASGDYSTYSANDAFAAYLMWEDTLIKKLVDVGTAISKKTGGRQPNVIVGRVDDLVHLRKFAARRDSQMVLTDTPNEVGNVGLTRLGTFASKYRVYEAQHWPSTYNGKLLVLGHYSDIDTAAVVAPYLDYVSPQLVLTSNLTNGQAYMSRAGFAVVNAGYTGTITIS